MKILRILASLLILGAGSGLSAAGLSELMDALAAKDTARVKKIAPGVRNLNALLGDDAPIHLAARSGKLDLIRYLASRGADLHLANYDGATTLMLASDAGCEPCVRYLLEQGLYVNALNRWGEGAVMYAASGNQPGILRLLHQKGAKLNRVNREGRTALSMAAFFGRRLTAEYLLEQGRADVNRKDPGGRHALYYAVKGNHLKLAEKLVARGADTNFQIVPPGHGSKMDFWFAAAYMGMTGSLKAMLRKGRNIHKGDKYNFTALMHAAQGEHPEAVRLLLSRGARVNHRARWGHTALYRAAGRNKDIQVIKLLLNGGAKINQKNRAGVSPYKYAVRNRNTKIAEYLRSRGGR